MKIETKIRIRHTIARRLGWLTSRANAIRILTFHSVQEHPCSLSHQSPAVFEQQIKYLADKAYTSLRVSDVLDNWPGILDKKRVVILTFDDGLYNNREIICPILKRYGMTATFFISTAYIGENRSPAGHDNLGAYKDVDMMAWHDLQDMINEGFEIGAHTHTHAQVRQLNHEEAAHELAISKKIIEEKLGVPVRSFAYPKGRTTAFAPWTRKILQQCGYAAGCTMMEGHLSRKSDLLQLPRIGIDKTDTLQTFQMKLRGNYDLLRLLH